MLNRLIVRLTGAVQGVGFRPFVYRIAMELGLNGYVLNDTHGVIVEVEGNDKSLESFVLKLNTEKPPLARIFSQDLSYRESAGYKSFEIKESKGDGSKDVLILPDISICDDCLNELFDISDRRYLYPFINCINCGPRFTIIENLPYDRDNTTMKDFVMCPDCLREYKDPLNRRFHAQPNACPVCGPSVSLYNNRGSLIADGEDALHILIDEIKKGSIAAIKGIGGFHLVCDAENEDAVTLLRKRKRRQEKPFAVMFHSIEGVKGYAFLSTIEEALLISPERPIVLVSRKNSKLAKSVAPELNKIGAFLPYAPLHHIILRKLNIPLVATSGNISDEPIVKDDKEALQRLSLFSDFILIHNRPIRRRCDDSVVKIIGGFPSLVRRARGYAPTHVRLPFNLKKRALAVGGFYKNTFAIGLNDKVIMSQHIGDLETVDAIEYFEEAVRDICSLYDFKPDVIVHDLHPGYETTKWALAQTGIEKIGVQHHFAHILSCMAENGIEGNVLGVAWDGTGYGNDGTLWGGEFLHCDYKDYKRISHFKQLRLIGGEKAIREPRRVAIAMLFEIFGEDSLSLDIPVVKSFGKKELHILFNAWRNGINSPYSSSAGRLFDGLASFLDIRHVNNYEGQAAMMIEDRYDFNIKDSYDFTIKDGVIDWTTIFLSVLNDKRKDRIPSMFINTLAEIILHIAKSAGLQRVCLSGGVFQNDPLTQRVIELLSPDFRVFAHKRIPPNDGCICIGQAVFAGNK
ncbi:MAG: carbamoyltransferase HypF [Thermodesulfovibrionales bacterium]|nr:carbamoyltransferase HypF [Thermodesulfovibrionales bacterium]